MKLTLKAQNEATRGFNEEEPIAPEDEPESVAELLRRLRRTVEVDHHHKFKRIESDLRWVIMLTSTQLVALVGGAIATITIS